MKNFEFMTEGQKTRARRDEAICEAYTALRREQPLVTKNRVLAKVAADFGLVGQTVKNVLRKNNAYI